MCNGAKSSFSHTTKVGNASQMLLGKLARENFLRRLTEVDAFQGKLAGMTEKLNWEPGSSSLTSLTEKLTWQP